MTPGLSSGRGVTGLSDIANLPRGFGHSADKQKTDSTSDPTGQLSTSADAPVQWKNALGWMGDAAMTYLLFICSPFYLLRCARIRQ
jgi:hypothetical protein